ncbi:glycosyltransferase family 2 protein [Sphingomonas oligoaromativorans]|jgi:glycosyltransferase involved in cell wall biosynthesis|uniref:glycosyltransferase family 2 protein n=1 Tax=Sphingomonas oligoaromativorans TaxID=575322 RepID=UPI001422EA2C|nr:glycosyltransferase family 2 protein [Sphingomonas oligoaromativorans]NIJ34987.1 glycosyltransferase involved in cell wall biosynthesis [Sphingomonas oligoaromativorans]
MISAELVSVVIPAYNAAATIDETLRSVRAQTHENLEILVVDDGSQDGTLGIARHHAGMDPRVRVLSQPNAGVAAARNHGWQKARSDFIAFVDADDLWSATKIERQLGALLAGGERVGLVYAWYQLIDSESRVLQHGGRPIYEGDVLDEIFCGNFIGNGSAALVRRQALIDAQGFESGLRDAGAQGCEDMLFYCRVAERNHFAVIPDYLVGYRYLPDNMSSNLPRMLRSWMLVMDEMEARHAEHHAKLATGLRNYGAWLLFKALQIGRLDYFREVLSLLARRDSGIALITLGLDLPRWLGNAVRWRLQALLGRLLRPRRLLMASFPIEEPRQCA